MRKIALMSAMLLCMYTAFAQTTIKGKVSDKSANTALSGATISVGSKSHVTTDKDGSFSFACTGQVTVTISYVGYETQKIKANCGDELNIQLTTANNTLDNVEISATSSQDKSLLSQPQSITKLTKTELKRAGHFPG